jgi:hypothetical protein
MEDQRLALEFDEAERSIMFINPNSMDATARAHWELAYAKIMAQSVASGCGNGGGDGSRGGDDGGEQVIV